MYPSRMFDLNGFVDRHPVRSNTRHAHRQAVQAQSVCLPFLYRW